MKSNELRIGNYIKLYRNPFDKKMTIHKIVSICSVGGNIQLEDDFLVNYDTGVVPIPLTEDMVLKCGFERYEDGTLHLSITDREEYT